MCAEKLIVRRLRPKTLQLGYPHRQAHRPALASVVPELLVDLPGNLGIKRHFASALNIRYERSSYHLASMQYFGAIQSTYEFFRCDLHAIAAHVPAPARRRAAVIHENSREVAKSDEHDHGGITPHPTPPVNTPCGIGRCGTAAR